MSFLETIGLIGSIASIVGLLIPLYGFISRSDEEKIIRLANKSFLLMIMALIAGIANDFILGAYISTELSSIYLRIVLILTCGISGGIGLFLLGSIENNLSTKIGYFVLSFIFFVSSCLGWIVSYRYHF